MRYLNLYSIDFVLYNFGTFAFWTWAAFTSAGRFGAPLLAAKAGLLASEKVKLFLKICEHFGKGKEQHLLPLMSSYWKSITMEQHKPISASMIVILA